MKTKLVENISVAKAALVAAEQALLDYEDSPEANTYGSLEEGSGVVEEALRDLAHADCEGSHNCGADKYERTFYVGDKRYLGTLTVEYNRHDKTYYYVDGCEFEVTEIVRGQLA